MPGIISVFTRERSFRPIGYLVRSTGYPVIYPSFVGSKYVRDKPNKYCLESSVIVASAYLIASPDQIRERTQIEVVGYE